MRVYTSEAFCRSQDLTFNESSQPSGSVLWQSFGGSDTRLWAGKKNKTGGFHHDSVETQGFIVIARCFTQ